MEKKTEPVLEVKNLSVSFRMYDGKLNQADLKVISDLSLTVFPGEIVAVAGSSGSGKSLLASAIMGLLPENALVTGELLYKREALTPERQSALRGRELALCPQSVAYLDPLMKVGKQAAGPAGKKNASLVQNIFKRFELPEHTAKLYPYQLSGGMARRVLVSTAVITGADLIIADEPTPGMSLAQAIEALKIFRELADAGKSVILITPDIDLAYQFADRIAVFYAGTTVEVAPAQDFEAGPQNLRHPYSQALWRALPQNGFTPIPGFQPHPKNLPAGCLFAPRCPHKTAECEGNIPMRERSGGYVRCIHAT